MLNKDQCYRRQKDEKRGYGDKLIEEKKKDNCDDNGNSFCIRVVDTADEIRLCRSLRLAVFVEEQKIPAEVEMDGKDDEAIHLLGYWNNEPVATGRMLLLAPQTSAAATTTSSTSSQASSSEDGYTFTAMDDDTNKATVEAVIGRIVVLSAHRKRGLGSKIVQKLDSIARMKDIQRITLTPHHYLQHFYENLGFSRRKNDTLVNVNEYCQLITMEKYL